MFRLSTLFFVILFHYYIYFSFSLYFFLFSFIIFAFLLIFIYSSSKELYIFSRHTNFWSAYRWRNAAILIWFIPKIYIEIRWFILNLRRFDWWSYNLSRFSKAKAIGSRWILNNQFRNRRNRRNIWGIFSLN